MEKKENSLSWDEINFASKTSLIFGKRATGKTTLAKELIEKTRTPDNYTLVFTPCICTTKTEYRDIDNKQKIYLSKLPENVETVLKQIVSKVNKPLTVVFDGYKNVALFKNCETVNKLINGGIENVTVIFTTNTDDSELTELIGDYNIHTDVDAANNFVRFINIKATQKYYMCYANYNTKKLN